MGVFRKFFQWVERGIKASPIVTASILILIALESINQIRILDFQRFYYLFLFVAIFFFYLLVVNERVISTEKVAEKLKVHRTQVIRTMDMYLQQMATIAERRLPKIEFIRGTKNVHAEIVKAIEEAKESIMAVGGRSKVEPYLKAIEDQVKNNKKKYSRVVMGNSIHHVFCQHLCSLCDHNNVNIAYYKKERYGNILIVDRNVVIVFIPSPDPKQKNIDAIVKIPDSEVGKNYYDYIDSLLFHREQKWTKKADIQSLCEKCGKSKNTKNFNQKSK